MSKELKYDIYLNIKGKEILLAKSLSYAKALKEINAQLKKHGEKDFVFTDLEDEFCNSDCSLFAWAEEAMKY